MKRNVRMWQAVVVVIGLMVAVATADASERRAGIVDPGQQYFGMSYNELVSEWTNWLVAEPMATNPAFDTDGSFCEKNQKGKVWFLASTFEGVVDRTCKVPAGKAIFFSLGGVFLSFSPEYPDPINPPNNPCVNLATVIDKIRCDASLTVPLASSASLEVVIDGDPVKDLFAFRAQSQPGGFTLHVPEPSLLTGWGYSSGNRFPAVADGYFMFLKPLSPGKHTLNIIMTYPGQLPAGVNYTLIVPRTP